MANTKKVLLFVVEGATEETALARIMENIFSTKRIFFDIAHGDITVQGGMGKKPRERIRDLVLAQMNRNKSYGWNDLEQIVQICDTDGAFVPDDKVLRAPGSGLEYREDAILSPNPEGIRARNKEKAESMRKLSRIHSLTYRGRSVPYALHYFSRNMEHALHGKAETLSDRMKIELANELRRRYENDPSGFRDFVNSAEVLVSGDFSQTWDYLESGVRSLERGSNIALAINGVDVGEPEASSVSRQ